MVENAVINSYLNNFRIALSRYLKPGVGIQTVSYPFNKGVVVVVEMDFRIQTKNENRSPSDDLSSALLKTNLFEVSSFIPTIPGTALIFSKNKIVILKTDQKDQWSESAVRTDIRNIVEFIKKVHK